MTTSTITDFCLESRGCFTKITRKLLLSKPKNLVKTFIPIPTRSQQQIHHHTSHSFHSNEVNAFHVALNATAIVIQHIADGINVTQWKSHEKEFVFGQIVLPGRSC